MCSGRRASETPGPALRRRPSTPRRKPSPAPTSGARVLGACVRGVCMRRRRWLLWRPGSERARCGLSRLHCRVRPLGGSLVTLRRALPEASVGDLNAHHEREAQHHPEHVQRVRMVPRLVVVEPERIPPPANRRLHERALERADDRKGDGSRDDAA
eukprot:1980263-Prymnesium_polylepis.1